MSRRRVDIVFILLVRLRPTEDRGVGTQTCRFFINRQIRFCRLKNPTKSKESNIWKQLFLSSLKSAKVDVKRDKSTWFQLNQNWKLIVHCVSLVKLIVLKSSFAKVFAVETQAANLRSVRSQAIDRSHRFLQSACFSLFPEATQSRVG